ncbi:GFA family protein [Rhizobium panacihumi]|uniref:GFA family protein n=1 Tax=Rhizobium panacihumi TaxID=2008450 RepID=UPI003D7BAA2B
MSEMAREQQDLHRGGCRCGAIRFEATAAPIYASYCHCGDCRRASGAPVAAFVGFLAADVRFEDASAATYGTAPVKRSFCGTCGAPIAYTDERLSDRIFFMLGAMDAPENYPPRVHGYVHEQLPFFHVDDGLPRMETMTVPRPSGENQ